MKKILFVCLGNICRSPAAHGIAEKLFPEFEIQSAGTGNWHIGNPPDPRSIKICMLHGIDISHQNARPVRIGDDEYYDMIIGMDAQNIRDLKNLFPEKNHHKISMLDRVSIADPYYGGEDGFEKMFQHISTALLKKFD